VDDAALGGIRAKLDRADAHLQDLRSQVGPFLGGPTHDFRGEIDAHAGKFAGYLVVHQEPPIEWSIIVGDFVHNLRSALDHLACLLVPKPGRATAWPIYDDREDFDCAVRLAAKRKRRGPLTGLDPDGVAFKFIELAQPYNGDHGAHFHPLHNLAALSNEDKHRAILAVTAGIPSDEPPKVTIDATNVEISNMWVQTAKPLKDGDQFMGADAEVTGPDPELEVDADIPFDVAFGEVMVTTRGLPQLLETVREVVNTAAKIPE
jgi:hypothetical protein